MHVNVRFATNSGRLYFYKDTPRATALLKKRRTQWSPLL